MGYQIAQIAGAVIIFLTARKKLPVLLNKTADEKGCFLLILVLIPLVIHMIIAAVFGCNVRPQWGYVFWSLIGIILYYYIPTETSKDNFKSVLKGSYTVMLIIFLAFGTMLTVEKNYRSRYPVASIFGDIKQIWNDNCNTPLKYVGGFHEWTFPLTIYGDTHPINIMDTYGYKNLWLDEDDLKKSGAFIIGRTSDSVVSFSHSACPYLAEDIVIEPKPYSFTLTNVLRQPRVYTIYYYIVSPSNN